MLLPSLQEICALTAILSVAAANVEKTIFLGPEPINVPQQPPTLPDLRLDVLTPGNFSLRTHLGAVFATTELPRGVETWLILDELEEGRRYEVRVCWLATQPTAFHLETYTLDHVFETPELITSLNNYSTSRQEQQRQEGTKPSIADPSTAWGSEQTDQERSVLFLRVSAAADYFTTNQTLMLHPELVLVDLILDPFVLNVLPRTLVPTVGYIIFVAAMSWVLATRLIVPWLTDMMVSSADEARTEKKAEKKSQ